MEIIKNICNYTNNKIYNNNISISKQRINVIEIINNLHNTKLCKDCFGTSNICKKNRCLVNRLKIIFDYIIVNNWDTTLDFVKIKQHVFLSGSCYYFKFLYCCSTVYNMYKLNITIDDIFSYFLIHKTADKQANKLTCLSYFATGFIHYLEQALTLNIALHNNFIEQIETYDWDKLYKLIYTCKECSERFINLICKIQKKHLNIDNHLYSLCYSHEQSRCRDDECSKQHIRDTFCSRNYLPYYDAMYCYVYKFTDKQKNPFDVNYTLHVESINRTSKFGKNSLIEPSFNYLYKFHDKFNIINHESSLDDLINYFIHPYHDHCNVTDSCYSAFQRAIYNDTQYYKKIISDINNISDLNKITYLFKQCIKCGTRLFDILLQLNPILYRFKNSNVECYVMSFKTGDIQHKVYISNKITSKSIIVNILRDCEYLIIK